MRAALTALLLAILAHAAGAAELAVVSGNVSLGLAGSEKPAQVSAPIEEGSNVVTAPGAEALIVFDDGAKLLVRPGTQLAFDEFRPASTRGGARTAVRLVRGGLRFVSGKTRGHKITFHSREVSVGIRGTDIDLVVTASGAAAEPGTYLRVNTGEAEMVAPDGTALVVGANETALSRPEVTRSFVPRPPFVRLPQPPAVFERSALDALLQ